jgi:hypothetical protein
LTVPSRDRRSTAPAGRAARAASSDTIATSGVSARNPRARALGREIGFGDDVAQLFAADVEAPPRIDISVSAARAAIASAPRRSSAGASRLPG